MGPQSTSSSWTNQACHLAHLDKSMAAFRTHLVEYEKLVKNPSAARVKKAAEEQGMIGCTWVFSKYSAHYKHYRASTNAEVTPADWFKLLPGGDGV